MMIKALKLAYANATWLDSDKSILFPRQTCEAVGELEGRDGADVYCMDQCIVYPSRCPANRCRCY